VLRANLIRPGIAIEPYDLIAQPGLHFLFNFHVGSTPRRPAAPH
jgi:hypothetical protein